MAVGRKANPKPLKATGKPKAASQRDAGIRATIAGHIESLIVLYETTDPALGRRSEEDKLERARQAISIWWYLYAELMLWAQSHLAGYEIGKSNPEFIQLLSKEFGEEITGDSHVLEYIGLQYSWNHVNYDDPMSERIQELLDRESCGLDDIAMRKLIRELLMSRSANSSFWRFDLQYALSELNMGHVADLLKPERTKRQGHPAALQYWKTQALFHVHFQIGKGLKKYRALELVAEALGQSVETLRSWEKSMRDSDDFEVEKNAATLAGQLGDELDRPAAELEKKYGATYHRHSSNIEIAQVVNRQIRANSLDKIKDHLSEARLM